jgi:hypothetical protein
MKSVVKNNPDSYSINNVSGRAKIYEYNGVKLKGTWEVKIATVLDKYNIKWSNNIKPFNYYWNNNWHLYFPDFYLEEYNLYLEVKGYQRYRDIEKWKVLNNLIVVKKYDIKKITIDDTYLQKYILEFKNKKY